MNGLDPCEECPYHGYVFDEETGCFKEVCKNKKPCPYISLDTIQ